MGAEARRCAYRKCGKPLPLDVHPKTRFCPGVSTCRAGEHKLRVREGLVAVPHRRPPAPAFGARVRSVVIDRPAVMAYVDPPYPGCAYMYPEDEEVDHEVLIRELVRDYPDGWALSTGAAQLQQVLALCPAGVRLGSWHRQARPTEEPAGWEPVIVCGGRRTPESVVRRLECRAQKGWGLPGAKPPPFYRWVFGMLGLRPGDTFVEPFPGSGTGARTWERFQVD
jgi:hypothetical protein